MMNRFSYFKYILLTLMVFGSGCFEEREFLWNQEVLEWEPPDRSTNALSMNVHLEAGATENQTVTLRLQYAGEQHPEDMTGTFAVDEQNSDAVEGEHFEIVSGTTVTIPAGSNLSEEIEIEIVSGSIQNGEELNLVLLITNEGDIPPMENYKEFNLFISKETGFLPVTEVTLEEPGFNAGLRLLDVSNGEAYSTNDADADADLQERVDLGLWNSSSTEFTMIVPTDSDRLGGWASGRRVRDDWVHKNDGILMKLPFDENNTELFEDVLAAEDLIAAFADAEEKIADLALETDDYGPGGHLQYVSEGEIIFFRSVDKDFHAIFLVDNVIAGGSGSATFLIKTTIED